jgi:hypothetical protein
MCTDKLHEYASELKRYVDDQAIFIAAEIEDHPVVGHEIHGSAELSLYLGGISPSRFGDSREPRPDRGLMVRDGADAPSSVCQMDSTLSRTYPTTKGAGYYLAASNRESPCREFLALKSILSPRASGR